MPLRNDAGPVEDRWMRLEPDALIGDGPIIVEFADAKERQEALLGRDPRQLGLHVPNDAPLDELIPWFDRVTLISVDFPSFSDGRGFSIGRALRAKGFSERLRAVGPIIADQYAYLRACGFDEVETPDRVANRQPESQWAAAAQSMSLSYQSGYGSSVPGQRSILEVRRAARADG